jgi:hypothetical protein
MSGKLESEAQKPVQFGASSVLFYGPTSAPPAGERPYSPPLYGGVFKLLERDASLPLLIPQADQQPQWIHVAATRGTGIHIAFLEQENPAAFISWLTFGYDLV